MKYSIIVYVLLLGGCALLSPSRVPSVVEDMVAKAAQKVAEEIGKELGDVPTTCEFEIDRLQKKLLMLCEADLK